MYSRTLTRAFVVCSILLFVLVDRLTLAVRTAYDSGWTAPDCSACRLSEAWIWVHTFAVILVIASITATLANWWLRRRRALSAETARALDQRYATLRPWIALFIGAALVAGLLAAVLTYVADRENHRAFVSLANALLLVALALLGAAWLFLSRTSRDDPQLPSAAQVAGALRTFLQRQRVALIGVVLFLVVFTVGGQTSGQAVDSIRVWTEFGDDRSLARLSFGFASILMLALVIYEGGIRLARLELGDTRRAVRARSWVIAAGVALGAWLILFLTLHHSLGYGVPVCAGILVVLGILELGRAEGAPFRRASPADHEAAVEFLAVLPLITLAIVAVSAAVDSGLAGASAWEALRILSPGLGFAALAVVMTSESRYEASPRPRWAWPIGVLAFAIATGLLVWFRLADWGVSSAVGFTLAFLAVVYAVAVFRARRTSLFGRLGGWQVSIPVALAVGITTYFLVELDPEGFGQSLGSFAIIGLSAAFIIAWLPWVIRWSLERRPPRVLWALGLQQLPIVTLVLVAWILAGVVKPSPTLHDVRLVDHGSDAPRPTLTDVFHDWVKAQPELARDTPGKPIPLVLVAAHGGGIRAAYWTALVLDCIVAVSPAEFDAGSAAPGDEQTCRTRRRGASAQRAAAGRIFLISSVSGGAMGMYAYARQLLADGSLGAEPDDDADSWENRRLAYDFASPTIAWTLFHDLPNHFIGLHPKQRGECGWHLHDTCATQDRAAVLEASFDDAFKGAPDATLRGTWEARARSARARAVPLLVANSTVTGGKARAVVSAADLGEWPRLEGSGPAGGADPRPLAGTVEVSDTLCQSNDLRLSTASLLGGRFPFVNPSGHLAAHCAAGDGPVDPRDAGSACAQSRLDRVCELNLVDGGYVDNSGLFTIVGLWPSLRQLVVAHNRASTRKIALVIVDIDNHYLPQARAVPEGSGSKSEMLVPLATVFGARAVPEVYAREAAQRITGPGCTLTISPRLHPGLIAPLGWELSQGSRDDLRRGLVEPRPNAPAGQKLTPVYDLRRAQAWLGGDQPSGFDASLDRCLPH
jgi:hypothetical protein